MTEPINVKQISAYTTGLDKDGERFCRLVHLEINPARTELDFYPALNAEGPRARVHYRKWNKELRRFDWFPMVVLQNTIDETAIVTGETK